MLSSAFNWQLGLLLLAALAPLGASCYVDLPGSPLTAPENSSARISVIDTIDVGSLTINDTTHFEIRNESNVFSLYPASASALDYEAARRIPFLLTAFNETGFECDDLVDVLNIEDVDEFPPVFTNGLTNLTISETAIIGSAVQNFSAPATFTASDADGNADPISFSLDPPHENFTIDGAVLRLAAALDYDANPAEREYSLTVKAENGDFATMDIIVIVLPENDNAPEFVNADQLRNLVVWENATAGTPLVIYHDQDTWHTDAVIDATDLDGDDLMYSLKHPSPFAVDPITGALTANHSSPDDIDYELTVFWNITVVVTDGLDEAEANITVFNVNVDDNAPEVTVPHLDNLTIPEHPCTDCDLSITSTSNISCTQQDSAFTTGSNARHAPIRTSTGTLTVTVSDDDLIEDHIPDWAPVLRVPSAFSSMEWINVSPRLKFVNKQALPGNAFSWDLTFDRKSLNFESDNTSFTTFGTVQGAELSTTQAFVVNVTDLDDITCIQLVRVPEPGTNGALEPEGKADVREDATADQMISAAWIVFDEDRNRALNMTLTEYGNGCLCDSKVKHNATDVDLCKSAIHKDVRLGENEVEGGVEHFIRMFTRRELDFKSTSACMVVEESEENDFDTFPSAYVSLFGIDVADINDAPSIASSDFEVNETVTMNTLGNCGTSEWVDVGVIEGTDADQCQDLEFRADSAQASKVQLVPLTGVYNFSCPAQFTGRRSAMLRLRKDILDYESQNILTIKITIADDGRVRYVNINKQIVYRQEASKQVQKDVTVRVLDLLDPPVITNVITSSPFGLTTAGGESVTIRGHNLGPMELLGAPPPGSKFTPAANYTNGLQVPDFRARNCRVTCPFQEIKCESSKGHGLDHSWFVIVGGQISQASEDVTSYARPTISQLSGSSYNASTAGGDTIIIAGSQFGSEDTDPPPLIEVYYFWTSSAGVEVQFAAEDCRITDAHREIRCAYTAGVGGNLRWQVRISNQSSDTPTTRYASPVITSVAAVRGPDNTNVTHSMSGQPEELAKLIVTGFNFGLDTRAENSEMVNPVDAVLYGELDIDSVHDSLADCATPIPGGGYTYYQCSCDRIYDAFTVPKYRPGAIYQGTGCTITQDHTEIECNAVQGTGRCLFLSVQIAGLTSAISPAAVSYAPPEIALEVSSAQAGYKFPTQGAIPVRILGRNLGGATARRLMVFLGRDTVPLEAVTVKPISTREFTFELPPGRGTGHPLWIYLADQPSNELTFTYDSPRVNFNGVTYRDGSLLNDQAITYRLAGRNFGLYCFGISGYNTSTEARCGNGESILYLLHTAGTCPNISTVDRSTLERPALTVIDPESVGTGSEEVYFTTKRGRGCVIIEVGGPFSFDATSFQLSSSIPAPEIVSITPESPESYADITIVGRKFGTTTPIVRLINYKLNSTTNTTDRIVDEIPSSNIDTRIHTGDTVALTFTMPEGHGNVELLVAIPAVGDGEGEEVLVKDSRVIQYRNPTFPERSEHVYGETWLYLSMNTTEKENLVNDTTNNEPPDFEDFLLGYSPAVGCNAQFTFANDTIFSRTSGGDVLVIRGEQLGSGTSLERRITVGNGCQSTKLFEGAQCEATILAFSSDYIAIEVPEGVSANQEIKFELFDRKEFKSGRSPFISTSTNLYLSYCDVQIHGVHRAFTNLTEAHKFENSTTHAPTSFAAGDRQYFVVVGENFGGAKGKPQLTVNKVVYESRPDIEEGTVYYWSRGELVVIDKSFRTFRAVTTSGSLIEYEYGKDLRSHHFLVREAVPGVGANLPLRVTVAELGSASSTFSYDPPTVLGFQERTPPRELTFADLPHNINRTDQGVPHQYSACIAQGVSTCFDATNPVLYIAGCNFGDPKSNFLMQLRINGEVWECDARTDVPDGDIAEAPEYIRCVFSHKTQPGKQIPGHLQELDWQINVGSQVVTMATNAHNARLTSNCGMPHKPPPPRLSLMAQCPYGTFYSSSTGECHTCTPEALAAGPARERAEALCDKCSAESALCLGGQNPLLSRAGFWRVAADVGYRLSRCSPLSSCDGQNGCALGYEGSECSECAADFSRNYITNACVPCPSLPGLYFAGMLILALVLAFVLQKLYKKGPSVAAIGITIDYFQVLSIFSSLELEWPESLLTVFRMASATASDVEVANPDCTLSFSYYEKWYFFQSLPLTTLVVLVLIHYLLLLKKKLTRRKLVGRSTSKHVSGMVGFYLLMLNFLYLMLAKKGFEVQECTDLDGAQKLSVDAAVACEGEEYEMAVMFGWVAVFFYGLGIPLLFMIIIFHARHQMKVDQALRIRNMAGSRDTNPYYDMQKRFRRLYFKFRPECYYWLLVHIAKKLMIVLILYVLQAKPIVAACTVLIVLFTCYVLHVNFRPYRLGTEQTKISNPEARRSSQGKTAIISPLSKDQQPSSPPSSPTAAANRAKGPVRGAGLFPTPKKEVQQRKEEALGASGLRVEYRTGGKMKIKTKFIFNYNALESTMLCCGIFVLMAGITFKSADLEPGSVAHTIMEVFVLTVVIVSTIICVASLVGEVWGSIKYYIRAAKIRYRSMTKRNSRKIVKNRPVPKVESALSGRTDDRWVAAQQSLTALKAKGKLRNKAASLQATMLNVLIDREDVQPEAVQEYITNHAGLTTPAAGSGKEGGKDGEGGKKGGKSKAVNSLMKQALWSKFYLSLHMHRITGLSVEPGTVLRFLLRVATKTVHFTCEYQERGFITAPEQQIEVYNVLSDAVHIGVRQAGVKNRTVMFASLPLANVSRRERQKVQIKLTDFSGEGEATLVMFARLSRSGQMVEDWIDLGLGHRPAVETQGDAAKLGSVDIPPPPPNATKQLERTTTTSNIGEEKQSPGQYTSPFLRPASPRLSGLSRVLGNVVRPENKGTPSSLSNGSSGGGDSGDGGAGAGAGGSNANLRSAYPSRSEERQFLDALENMRDDATYMPRASVSSTGSVLMSNPLHHNNVRESKSGD